MDRALLVICALLLNTALGGPRRWYMALGTQRIARFPAQLIRAAERRLNRDYRSMSERRQRGALLVAVAIAFSLLCGWLGSHILTANLHFVEIALLALMLPLRPAWDIAAHIRNRLRAGDIAGARGVLEGTPWRHHALMDEHALARAAIETLAISFSEKILAPIGWYLLLGLPGLFMSKTIYLMQETLTRPLDTEQAFGKAAHMVHGLLHWIPSRLAAILWLLASAFVPAARIGAAVKQLMRGMLLESPQRLSLLAAASVLGLALGGPSSAYGAPAWIGLGIARATAADIRRALYLFGFLCLLLFSLAGLFI